MSFDDRVGCIIADVIKESRNNTLDAAIELAEDFAKSHHDLQCYIRAL